MNKNDTVLSNLIQLDITKLKDEELNKTAQTVAKMLNVNGLRRNVNTALFQIIEMSNTIVDNNKKLEIIKKLLQGQKTIEQHTKNFRRKNITKTETKDIKDFITITVETLTGIKNYIPKKEQPKKTELKELKTVKELGETTELPVAKVTENKPTTKATTPTKTTKK